MADTRTLPTEPPTGREWVTFQKQFEAYVKQMDARFLRIEIRLNAIPWVIIGIIVSVGLTLVTIAMQVA